MSNKNHNFNSYFFSISTYPRVTNFNEYYYETNIYGESYTGYLTEQDSVIYFISNSDKYLFVDFRRNNKEINRTKRLVPQLIKDSMIDWYKMEFLTPPHTNDSIKGLRLRMTYKIGIDSIIEIRR